MDQLSAASSTMPPRYIDQNCTLTLREALDEFYSRNPEAIRKTGDQTKDDFFQSHDTIHVVFGCDTNIHDEVLADMWTIFGSDLGFANYLNYLEPLKEDLKDILKDAGTASWVWQSTKAIPAVLQVIWRSRKMSNKWHWRDHKDYLDQSLKDVRRELDIRVVA